MVWAIKGGDNYPNPGLVVQSAEKTSGGSGKHFKIAMRQVVDVIQRGCRLWASNGKIGGRREDPSRFRQKKGVILYGTSGLGR